MSDNSTPNYSKPRDSAAHHVTVDALHKPAEGYEKHVAPTTVPLPEKGFMSAHKGHVSVEALHKPAEGFEKHVAPTTVPLPEKGFMSAHKGHVEVAHLHAPAEAFHKPAPKPVTVPAQEANFMKARSDAAHSAPVEHLHAPAPAAHKHVQPTTKADPVKHYMQ